MVLSTTETSWCLAVRNKIHFTKVNSLDIYVYIYIYQFNARYEIY